jgi:hypothetical protein
MRAGFTVHDAIPSCHAGEERSFGEYVCVHDQSWEEDEMNRKHKKTDDLRSYCLSIRWNARQHRTLADTAWQARTSISDFVRGIVIDQLRRDGVKLD